MNIKNGKLPGVKVVRPTAIKDERGFFMRVYDAELFDAHAVNRIWVQENHSLSNKKGVIRGLHFQFSPHAEAKLIRCIRGAILDVFVDLRKDSPTFGSWDSVELSEENKKMVLVPRGLAHGFCTLSENCEVLYKVDNAYAPEAEGGIVWNDPYLEIDWPVQEPILSDKDKALMSFQEFCQKHAAIDLKRTEDEFEYQTV